MALGEPVRRVEDERFLQGKGRYCEDILLPGMVHAVFVRSPVAHAEITRRDLRAARAMAGVLAVYDDADVRRWELGALPCIMRPEPKPGTELALPPRWALARERVRHAGEAVAMVVAETVEQARDAAERIQIDYEALPVVVDARVAGEEGQPQLHEAAPGNLAVDWEQGDRAAVEAALATAAHRVRLTVANNRLICNPLEPRGAVGDWDRRAERLVLYTGSQGVHLLRAALAEQIFRLPQSALRVVTDDVGGSFGMKMYVYPEQVMVLAAARALGRPVKWICERAEGCLTDSQGRDLQSDAELGLDAEGRFLALRVESCANLGAYLSSFGPFIPTAGGTRALAGPYRTSLIYVGVKARFTNTAPTDAYRGAGRPEMAFLLETLVDRAARQLGLDRADLRRRNLIAPEAMPYRSGMGLTYDSGDFPRTLQLATERIGWAGFEARRDAARARGRLAGIGLAMYVEPCGGGRDQRAEIRLQPDGTMTALLGSQSTGMGHETAYAQILAERLGAPLSAIRVIQGDSDLVSFGRGTSGSRSIPIGGNALAAAADRVLAKAREIAAHHLEAATADLEFGNGRFTVVGTDRSITLQEIIRLSFEPRALPPGMEAGLDSRCDYYAEAVTFPNGCHACEVEIDPETGVVRLSRYLVVDDFGRVLNPLLVEGQVHGGLAQGIGQALLEQAVYDPQSGQLLSGSFLDYAMPRADELPTFQVGRIEVPCTTNGLGVKGCGEAGAMGAPPAIMSAVRDALAPLGIADISMPATPLRVWQAIAAAKREAGG
ncbi:MAG TPA: xanthine dehydrogenase family protein molybdopterin-binding subunit [Kiloniellales bacterium]|nr:xanthine dehydrogenase family protein molybdopterin-binding subunit [Kiloniellales bacterium]